jgi:hypothetical protein
MSIYAFKLKFTQYLQRFQFNNNNNNKTNSPFDQRCIGIHDPRVEGDLSAPAWLPHAETLINKIANGNNVDKFYHERMASMYNSCTIYGYVPEDISIMHTATTTTTGPSPSLKNDSAWRHFFEHICNIQTSTRDVLFDPKKHTLRDLSEEHKLEIVLKMRQHKLSQSYGYIPTHLLCGELCMILQERKFQLVSVLLDKKGRRQLLEEVSGGDDTVPLGALQFKTYEIAFGPVGDPTVRVPSVWFDIPEEDLAPCTPQQAKHHKRSRHRIKKSSNRTTPAQVEPSFRAMFKNIQIEPFFNYQPLDQASFNLITDLLVHRLKMVKLLSGEFDDSIHEVGIMLDSERRDLKKRYLSMVQFWIVDSWPEEALQEPIDNQTDVPSAAGKYSCSIEPIKFPRAEICYGLSSKRLKYDMPLNSMLLPSILWKSFVTNMLLSKSMDIESVSCVYLASECCAEDCILTVGSQLVLIIRFVAKPLRNMMILYFNKSIVCPHFEICPWGIDCIRTGKPFCCCLCILFFYNVYRKYFSSYSSQCQYY